MTLTHIHICLALALPLAGLLDGGQDSDPQAVALLTAVAHRLDGIDHRGTLLIVQISGADTIRTQRLRFWMHFPPAGDSLRVLTHVVRFPGRNRAGQKYWHWLYSDGRERQWIHLSEAGRLREIARRRWEPLALFDFDELTLTAADIAGMTHTLIPGAKGTTTGTITSPATGTLGELLQIRSVPRKGYRRKGRLRRPATRMLWIDPARLLIRRAETYSTKGNLTKRIVVLRSIEVAGHSWAAELEVQDVRRGTLVRITLTALAVGPEPDLGLFRPGTQDN